MKGKFEHIGIIPARKNSKGLKFKNRKLFNNTADFVKNLTFLDQIIVASDDMQIGQKAKKYEFNFYKRSKENAKHTSSIKSLMIELVKKKILTKTL